jgi:hypothetical protein
MLSIPGVVPIPAAPGRSRIAAIAEVDLSVLERIVGGEVIDTLAEPMLA